MTEELEVKVEEKRELTHAEKIKLGKLRKAKERAEAEAKAKEEAEEAHVVANEEVKVVVAETPEIEYGTEDRARKIKELNLQQKNIPIEQRKVFWQVKKNYHKHTGTTHYQYGWYYVQDLLNQLEEAVSLRKGRFTYENEDNTVHFYGLGGQYVNCMNIVQPLDIIVRVAYSIPMLMVEDGHSPLGSMV